MTSTTSGTTQVLSLRIESELFDRLQDHAARRGMSVQDYVVRTLVRDDFDERFKASVDETERFYAAEPPAGAHTGRGAGARTGAGAGASTGTGTGTEGRGGGGGDEAPGARAGGGAVRPAPAPPRPAAPRAAPPPRNAPP